MDSDFATGLSRVPDHLQDCPSWCRTSCRLNRWFSAMKLVPIVPILRVHHFICRQITICSFPVCMYAAICGVCVCVNLFVCLCCICTLLCFNQIHTSIMYMYMYTSRLASMGHGWVELVVLLKRMHVGVDVVQSRDQDACLL